MLSPFRPFKRIFTFFVIFFLCVVMVSTNEGITKLDTSNNWELVYPVGANSKNVVPSKAINFYKLHHPFWSFFIIVNKTSTVSNLQLTTAYLLIFPYWVTFAMIAAIVANFVSRRQVVK
jgi:hypothetical protein